MESLSLKKEAPLWIVALIPFLYISYVWKILPDTIPIHFDMNGEANGWGNKGMAFLLPVIGLIMYVSLLWLPTMDPKKMSSEFYKTNFYKIRCILSLFLAALSVIIIHLSLTGRSDIHGIRIIPIAIMAFLMLLGNFMINMKPNWLVGVRTPWTLSSDYVWKQTHLLLGRMWFFGGLISIILALILGGKWLTGAIVALTIGSYLFAMMYSFILYKREEANENSKGI